jgi:uncharacterized membrane protein YkoI
VNKKIILSSAIVGAEILFLLAIIYATSPLGYLSAQKQMVMNGNISTHDSLPKINSSINVGQELKNFFKENTKIPFTTAAETALNQIPNGKVLGGHLAVTQGYLTYTFFVVDPTNETVHKVIVDTGNGKVLYTSEGFSIGSFGSSRKGRGAGAWNGLHGSWKSVFGGFWYGI